MPTTLIDVINNNQIDAKYRPMCDGGLIGSGTFAGDLGGITIWNPWSNKIDANQEDSACTVRVLLFFPIIVTLPTFFEISLQFLHFVLPFSRP